MGAREIAGRGATFPGEPGFSGMKTFLKILVVAALLLLAIKFSPVLFVLALVGLLAAVVLGAVGLSLVAALAGVLIAFAVALAPVWIPVLVVIGLVSLFRRERNVPPVAA